MVKTVGVAALLALLAACSGSPSDPAPGDAVEFAALGTSYRAGDTVRVELRNTGSRAVGYNLCDARLERREAFGWARDERYFVATACLAMLFRLEPGATAPTFRVVPAGMEPGTYRLWTQVSVGERGGGVVRTQPFTVERR